MVENTKYKSVSVMFESTRHFLLGKQK